ncbi:MAG: class I SAM-dependent methyltransferase [Candidatus Dormibacteraeota bacterium]|nr:class I SAM-dependent methyltransferase [Candidatus Dormibacteraeota bacterium]MBV9525215.1 class I SAM-dependent methyltransferase [Candidatus Dormibacteraeota bacterium]
MPDGFQRQQRYREQYRARRDGWVDAVTLFRDRVVHNLRRDVPALDLGCGHLVLHGDSAPPDVTVVGVEPDLAALRSNTLVTHRVRAAGEALPFADASFGLVASAWVLEHLDNPGLVFAEIARVLRPGGSFVFLTPNAWNYNAWLIRAVPNRWHGLFTRRLYARREGDTYPVRYRANSPRSLPALLAAAGFSSVTLEYNGDPTYIAFNRPLFEGGVLLERLMDVPALHRSRVHIIGSATR